MRDNCLTCYNGTYQKGKTTTVKYDRGYRFVVVEEVPVSICDNCGDYVLNSEVAGHLQDLVNEAFEKGEGAVQVLPYLQLQTA